MQKVLEATSVSSTTSAQRDCASEQTQMLFMLVLVAIHAGGLLFSSSDCQAWRRRWGPGRGRWQSSVLMPSLKGEHLKQSLNAATRKSVYRLGLRAESGLFSLLQLFQSLQGYCGCFYQENFYKFCTRTCNSCKGQLDCGSHLIIRRLVNGCRM